jgi:selenocysteine lyase/cysteine desulfurase
MLPCQRDKFDIPEGVTYLNAAAMSPLPKVGLEAAAAGAAAKGHPWSLSLDALAPQLERARAAAASLIGATADDIAVTGSTSYGIATAGLNIKVPTGHRILILQGEHSSQVLQWLHQAEQGGAVVETIARPEDDDWTGAVLARIETNHAPPVAIAALTASHWTDGTIVDLARIAPVLRAHGGALVIDGTQAVGVLPIDVTILQPDFIAFPTYKWVLGPYSFGFLYAAPHRQNGIPLEHHGHSRTADAFLPGARRYDLGERNNPIAIPIATAGLELAASWGPAAVSERLRMLTDRIADAATALGIAVPARRHRVPHIAGLRFNGGVPPGLADRLAADNIHVAERGGVLRVSPHVYNDEADVDRFAEALKKQAALF